MLWRAAPELTMANLLKDRYQLIRELGHGGMGVVYLARDTLLDREVAVKVLSEASRSHLGTEGSARLLHEAQSAARLNHPNIVSIFDAGEDQGASFIVMEWIDGDSLFDIHPASLQESLPIIRQVCKALEHAHAHGIIHRDLKPENILVTRDGKVKLTDFGLARSVSSRLMMDGQIVGTVLYLAPEAALRQPYDERVDLYSLGVVLYELASGCLPYTGSEPMAVISQHLYAPVVPPRAHNPDIPPALEQLILRLMSKKPEDRPQSAAENPRAGRDCAAALYKKVGITNPRKEFDCAEIYVAFSWFEPMLAETLGFAEPGEGWSLSDSGATSLDEGETSPGTAPAACSRPTPSALREPCAWRKRRFRSEARPGRTRWMEPGLLWPTRWGVPPSSSPCGLWVARSHKQVIV